MEKTSAARRTIRERRETLGWTKTYLAETSGISRPTLIALEDGRNRTQPEIRRKVEDALSGAEEARQEEARRFGVDAYNATARAVADLEEMLDRDVITPGGALLSLRSVVDAYAEKIEEMDPEAVGQAVEYTASLVKARMRTRAERN